MNQKPELELEVLGLGVIKEGQSSLKDVRVLLTSCQGRVFHFMAH